MQGYSSTHVGRPQPAPNRRLVAASVDDIPTADSAIRRIPDEVDVVVGDHCASSVVGQRERVVKYRIAQNPPQSPGAQATSAATPSAMNPALRAT